MPIDFDLPRTDRDASPAKPAPSYQSEQRPPLTPLLARERVEFETLKANLAHFRNLAEVLHAKLVAAEKTIAKLSRR